MYNGVRAGISSKEQREKNNEIQLALQAEKHEAAQDMRNDHIEQVGSHADRYDQLLKTVYNGERAGISSKEQREKNNEIQLALQAEKHEAAQDMRHDHIEQVGSLADRYDQLLKLPVDQGGW